MLRLNAAIPWLYAVMALAFGLLLAWTTPPFQLADETTHFERADALTFGPAAFARSGPDGDGYMTATVHQAVIDAEQRTDRLKFHPEAKALRDDLGSGPDRLDGRTARIAPGQAFNPLLYAPAGAAVAWGRHFGWTVLDTLRLARHLNLFASIGLGVVALSLAGGARLPIFALLMLPMSLALGAGVSQDGPILGLTALMVALVSRAMFEDRPLRRWESLAAALAAALVAVAKPPCVVLALLLLVVPADDRRLNTVAAGLALIAAVAWNAWMTAAGWPPPPPPGLSPDLHAQLKLLLGHPDRLPAIAAATFEVHGEGYLRQMVGVLGWLDAPLPETFYPPAFAMLAAALLIPLSVGVSGGWRMVRAAAPLLAATGAALVFAALYLSWSAVGASVIEGVQGRYLLPLALMLPLAIEGPRPLLRGGLGGGLRMLLSAAVLAFPLVSLVVTQQALISRYYMP